MNAFNRRLLLLVLYAMMLAPPAQAIPPSPEAQQLIAELGLSEGPAAISEQLAGADGVIGFCSPPTLQVADSRLCAGCTTTPSVWTSARA